MDGIGGAEGGVERFMDASFLLTAGKELMRD